MLFTFETTSYIRRIFLGHSCKFQLQLFCHFFHIGRSNEPFGGQNRTALHMHFEQIYSNKTHSKTRLNTYPLPSSSPLGRARLHTWLQILESIAVSGWHFQRILNSAITKNIKVIGLSTANFYNHRAEYRQNQKYFPQRAK